MPPIPSLDEMSPATWLQAMHAVRSEVAEEAARVLDTHTEPETAAEPLQDIFDLYQVVDAEHRGGGRTDTGPISVEVRTHDDTLIFWVFPTEEYETLVYTGQDYWWFDHQGTARAGRSTHRLHFDLVLQILQLIPWANDDDLEEMVAIEIGSRSG